jgi:hypothetical protein
MRNLRDALIRIVNIKAGTAACPPGRIIRAKALI